MPPLPIIVVTEGLESAPLRWLKDCADVREVKWTNTAALATALADADGAIVRTYTQVNDAFLDQGPKLRVVGRAGVGLDNIDMPACQRRGIKIFSTPTANSRAVVEYVFNLLFSLGRPLINLAAPISPEEFHAYRKSIRGLELSGKTMAILGMGRIGRGIGRVAHAFEMKVIYNDLLDVSSLIDYPALAVCKPDLYEAADVLTIHVNHQPNNLNHHLVNASAIARMKPSAYLINTSRGEVVDAAALADALKNHRICGAAIDVHEPEPPGPDYPLWNTGPNINMILAPHLAARTQGAMDAMSWVCRDVFDFLKGD